MIRARFTLVLALVLLLTLSLPALGEQPAVTDAEFAAPQAPSPDLPAPTFTVITMAPQNSDVPTALATPGPGETPQAPELATSPDPQASPTPPATRAPIPEGDMPEPAAQAVDLAIVTDPQGASLFEMPATESPILASLEPAQVLSLVILGVTWSRVQADAVTGWVPTYALGFSFGSPQPGIAVVTAPGGRLTLRGGMSTRSDALGSVSSGHAVLLLAKSQDFSLIRFEGKEGYVLTEHLREEFPGWDLGMLMPVISVDASRDANVRLRAEPSRQGVVYTTVPSGSSIVVFERAEGWARVEFEGHSGYMVEDYLGPIE